MCIELLLYVQIYIIVFLIERNLQASNVEISKTD